jgi:hypothetical protein
MYDVEGMLWWVLLYRKERDKHGNGIIVTKLYNKEFICTIFLSKLHYIKTLETTYFDPSRSSSGSIYIK